MMNKRIAAAALTLMLGISLFPGTAFAFSNEGSSTSDTGVIVAELSAEETAAESSAKLIGTVKAKVKELNIRAGQGTDYCVIGTLKKGDTVDVLEDCGDWIYIETPGKKGYVSAKYLDITEETKDKEKKEEKEASDATETAGSEPVVSLPGIPGEEETDTAGETETGEGTGVIVRDEILPEETEGAELTEEAGETDSDGGLTPEGNLSLVDDYGIETKDGKQFITLVSKNGNYFYLVIDRDKDGNETVHFLNQVDEEDLFSLMDEDSVTDMKSQIAAEEAAKEAAEAAEKEKAEAAANLQIPEIEKPETPETEKANPLLLALPLILVFGGVAVFVFLKAKRGKTAHKPDPDFGYRDDDDMDFYDLPEETKKEIAEYVKEEDPDEWLDEDE